MSMRTILPEVRRATRELGRSPGLVVFATLALALGVAGPTTMYAIAHGVLQDLPVPEGERLVHIATIDETRPGVRLSVRAHDLIALSEQLRTLTGVGAFAHMTHDVASAGERAERRSGVRITPDAFRVLGVNPAAGRHFTAADALPGAAPVAIIAHDLWRTWFHADADVTGRTLRLDGRETTIIGVMPPNFHFPGNEQIWTPLILSAAAAPERDGWQYIVFGRMRRGARLDAVKAEAATIARRLELAQPATNEGVTFLVRPYREQMLGPDLRRILGVMVALVSCMLLVAAANVANLLVARGVVRGRNVAIRSALGASRGRIAAEQLLEAGVIALAGGALGLLLSRGAIALFTRALAADLPYWAEFRLAVPILLFAAACIIVAALAAGAVPALQASGVNLQDVLRDEGRGASSFRMGRASRVLVAAQIGFSCALLIVAGLMIKGVLVMSRTSGYEPDRVAVGRYDLRSPRYERPQLTTFHRDVLERARRIPGVTYAAATSHLPRMGTDWRSIEVEGARYDADAWPEVHTVHVSPGYFAALGAGPVLRGRDFDWSDDDHRPRVAVVNVAFAHRFFGGDDVVGNRFRVRRGLVDPGPWTTIVGLVPNVGIRAAAGDSEDAIYLPLAQHPQRSVALMLHSTNDPAALLPALRAAVHDVDPELALYGAGRLDHVIRDARTTERVFGILFASFGAAALLLAMIGLYGTVAFSVSRRTREFGIRAALGAQPRDVLLLTLRGSMSYIAGGTALGVLLAMAVAPFFDYALFGISPRDPFVYAGVIGTLAVTALCAVLVPAARVAGTPPTAALLNADG